MAAERSTLAQNVQLGQGASLHQGDNLVQIVLRRINLAQRQKRCDPSHNIPFARDENFVGRSNELDQVGKELGPLGRKHTRAALVGLGGVGKSQIAIEHGYRTRDEYPRAWVFWVYAGTSERFKQAYRDIATRLELPGREDPNNDVCQLSYNWLSDERNGPWLLILDNADDSAVFDAAPGSRSLARFLPQSCNGSILVTSRFESAARKLTGRLCRIDPMGDEPSLKLLKSKLTPEETMKEETQAIELVRLLEGIPLAISHAAAYIFSRRRMTISRYIDLIKESEEKQLYLLSDEKAGDLRRDPDVHNSVLLTWQISFQQIQHIRPAAIDLLSFMCMLENSGIPEGILKGETDEFEEDIEILLDFALLQEQAGGGTFDMHWLVQLATRRWLKLHNQLSKWIHESISRMANHFPNGGYDTWTACEVLLPHAQKILSYRVDEQGSQQNGILLDQALLKCNVGQYTVTRGDYRLGETLHKESLDTREKILEPEHNDILMSMNLLAMTYMRQERWNEAERLQVQITEITERTYGLEHPNTLSCCQNLASTYSNQGRLEEAEKLSLKVLETRKKILGIKHPDTLTIMSNHVMLLRDQGKEEEALKLNVQVMEIRQEVLGINHPSTQISMESQAIMFRGNNQLDEAEKLHRQVMEYRRENFGTDHPDTLLSALNLCAVFSHQQRFREAEEMLSWVVDTGKEKFHPEHPRLTGGMASLAFVRGKQGKYSESEKLYLEVLELRKKDLGVKHSDTLRIMLELAFFYADQGLVRWEKAASLYTQVLHCCGDKAVELETALTSIINLGKLLLDGGFYEEAGKLHWQALDVCKQKLGLDHRLTLHNMYNLAVALRHRGRFDEAEELYTQTLDIGERTLGPDDLILLGVEYDLAYVRMKLGRESEALHLMESCVERYKRVMGKSSSECLLANEVLAEWSRSASLSGRVVLPPSNSNVVPEEERKLDVEDHETDKR